MNKDKLLQDLKSKMEIVADSHDGSYTLVRETIAAYASLDDFDKITYLDLDAVYLMSIGTWKINVEKKKDKVEKTCLSQESKAHLMQVLDRVWDNACRGKYENREDAKKPSVGMFGTGFMSFKSMTTDDCARRFIEMCVEISLENDENTETIYAKAEKVINSSFKGMGAASASIILHCLKPCVFPIINGNMGNGSIFSALGINIVKPKELATYIGNCRRINDFRNAELPFRNYRVMDMMAWELDKYQDDYFPSLSEYNPQITKEQYLKYLQDENVVKKEHLDVLYYMYLLGGEASCKQLALKYGKTHDYYRNTAVTIARSIQGASGCTVNRRENGGDRYWSILFLGRNTTREEDGSFIWKMRTELGNAIAELDEAGFFEGVSISMSIEYDRNLILYGPPGTGKTYSTAIYAVAICDGVDRKTLTDYDAVMERYNQLKAEGRVAFTTFHQSYGYEEFIEGIRPVVDTDSKDVSYTILSGVFKRFCEVARTSAYIDVNPDASIWFMRLENDDSTTNKAKCFANNELIANIQDGDEWSLERFVHSMQIGDYVLSYAGNSVYIDAVGVVVSEAEHDESRPSFQWKRKIKWYIFPEKVDVKGYNNNKYLPNFSIAKMNHMKVSDLLRLLPQKHELSEKPYVFVIDEINRGNIAKIFGELITLIEDTKREGMKEAASAILPYSNDAFSVPRNVYILGTMNTADRSIALMDTALRRRFSFVEMMPKPDVLDGVMVNDGGVTVNVSKLLSVINDRIEYLYDREHTIGHAFFTGLIQNPTLENLSQIFRKSVIPLLQEYFYEDYSKIQLVLGYTENQSDDTKFVRRIQLDTNLFKTGCAEVDIPDCKYVINESAFKNILSYKEIGEGI